MSIAIRIEKGAEFDVRQTMSQVIVIRISNKGNKILHAVSSLSPLSRCYHATSAIERGLQGEQQEISNNGERGPLDLL